MGPLLNFSHSVNHCNWGQHCTVQYITKLFIEWLTSSDSLALDLPPYRSELTTHATSVFKSKNFHRFLWYVTTPPIYALVWHCSVSSQPFSVWIYGRKKSAHWRNKLFIQIFSTSALPKIKSTSIDNESKLAGMLTKWRFCFHNKFAFVIEKQIGLKHDTADAKSFTISGEPIWFYCVPRLKTLQ